MKQTMIKLAAMLLLFSACSKEEPQPDKMIEVTYGVIFDKATDFTFKYSSEGSNSDTLYSVSSHQIKAMVKDQANRNNVWVGACVIKPSDIGNVSMKVYAIEKGDTIKFCDIGSCCEAYN